MSGPEEISTRQFQKNIFFFGLINCGIFIIVIFLFRIFNFRYAAGLLIPLNCVLLCLSSFYQVKRWVKQTRTTLPFLRAFSLVFFTGTCAFILFGGFIILYSQFSPALIQLYRTNIYDKVSMTPVIVTVAEGIGGSIIVALIGMMYSDRFTDHEVNL